MRHALASACHCSDSNISYDGGRDHSHKGVIACASQSNVIRMVNTSIRPAFLRRIENLFSAPNPSIHAANALLVTART
jgi:hypothetical protein